MHINIAYADMFDSTIESAVKNAISDSCNSDTVTKEELEHVLTASLLKIFNDRDFVRFVDEKLSERRR